MTTENPLSSQLAPIPGEAAALPQLDGDMDDLMANPYWEQLDDPIASYVRAIPPTSEISERTTILTWLYQENGVLTFEGLVDRIETPENLTYRKKTIRRTLRYMQDLHLVRVVNFAGEDDVTEGSTDASHASEDMTDELQTNVGQNSMVSLTWTGMVWLRRAWAARAKLINGRPGKVLSVHKIMVEEEDEGRATEPVWVENISGKDPDLGDMRERQAEQIRRKPIANSVFDLASAMR